MTHLGVAGFEVFCPRAKFARIGPLFVGYVFVHVVDLPWKIIRRTPGVFTVLLFGDAPAICPDREIEALRARLDENGIVRLPPAPSGRKIPIGAKVTARQGLIAGLYAGQSARQREIILITMLGKQNRVELKRGEMLQVVGSP